MMEKRKFGRMLAVFALFIAMLVFPAFAFNMTSSKSTVCVGPSCTYPGGTLWGTATPGTSYTRNMTFYFDVSPLLGHQISNLTVALSGFGASWGFGQSGGGGKMTGILGFNSSYSYQPFGSVGDANAATKSNNLNTSYCIFGSTGNITCSAANNTNFNFNGTYFVTDNILAVAWAGYPYVSASSFNCAGTVGYCDQNNTKWYGVLTYTDNGVFGNYTIPNVTESYWPIDNEKDSTFNEANAMNFLSLTRNIPGEGNYVVVKTGALTRSTKAFENGRLWLAFAFNTSTSEYPSSARVFMQVNETYMASTWMGPYKQTGVGGGWYDRYFTSRFRTDLIDTDFGRFHYFEVTTDAASGQHPFFCWSYFDRIPSTTQALYRGICSAPNGTANANDRVVLKDTLGNYYADVSGPTYADKTQAVEMLLNGSRTYQLVFVTTARGNITESMIGQAVLGVDRYLGTAYLTSMQGRNDYNTIAVSLVKENDAMANYAGYAKVTVLKADDYSQVLSQSITTNTGNFTFASAPSPDVRTAYFVTVHHREPTLMTATNDILLGVVHLFKPTSEQATVSVSCASPVQFISGQPQPVVCDTIYNADVTAVGDISVNGLNSQVVQEIDGDIYRTENAYTGSIASVVVTDAYSGTVVPAQVGGGKLTLQNLVVNGPVGFLKLASFNGRFTDTFGAVSVVPFSFTEQVVDHITDVTPAVNHRAVFLSYYENITGDFNLFGAVVNISGQVCTTGQKFRSSTNQTVAECDLIVPNSLIPSLTTYEIPFNGTYHNITLNQTYWGFYDTNEWSDLGIGKGDYGSVYLLSFNDLLGSRAYEKFDIGTCNEPEVNHDTVDQNDRCKPKGCPTSNTIAVVETVSVNPWEYVCQAEGQSTCKVDTISNKAYVASCGTVCGLTTRLCTTAACNSDNSGCTGEPTIQEIADNTGLTGMFVANPLMKFIFVDNMTFFVGLILVIAITVYLYMNAGAALAGIIGGFLLLGLVVIALPGGFLILLLVAVIVVVYLGYQAYAGITGMQIK